MLADRQLGLDGDVQVTCEAGGDVYQGGCTWFRSVFCPAGVATPEPHEVQYTAGHRTVRYGHTVR